MSIDIEATKRLLRRILWGFVVIQIVQLLSLTGVMWYHSAELSQCRAKAARVDELEVELEERDATFTKLKNEITELQSKLSRLEKELADRAAQGENRPKEKEQPVAASILDWFTFFPAKFPEGDWRPAGLAFEDVRLKAADGVELHAWYCPHEKPRAAVLVSQGNAGNLSFWAEFVRYLHDKLGVSALIYDYRGYGQSQGSPSVAGILLDARAARDELAKRERISPSEVILFGRSIGGAVAIDLAAESGARGLVVESTFSSLRDVAGMHYPRQLVSLVVPDVLNSFGQIGKYQGPLLISHGNADRIVPYSHGQKLFAAAHEPKQFITISGGDHNDPQSPEYYAALDKFIGSLPPVAKSTK